MNQQARGSTLKVAGLKKSQASFAKTDQRFWLQPGRLFKKKGAAAYSCRIQFGGDRLRFGLGSSNQAAAAAKAAGIYQSLTTAGKDANVAKFKPKAAERADVSTVGEWISAVETHCPLFPATLQTGQAHQGTAKKIKRRFRRNFGSFKLGFGPSIAPEGFVKLGSVVKLIAPGRSQDTPLAISYREFSVLCAILSTVGDKALESCSWREIARKSMGYATEQELKQKLWERPDGLMPWTRQEIRSTLDDLTRNKRSGEKKE